MMYKYIICQNIPCVDLKVEIFNAVSKKDLNKKSEVDRLVRQLMGFKKNYSSIIIVFIGNTGKEQLENLKGKLENIKAQNTGFIFSQEKQYIIIEKK